MRAIHLTNGGRAVVDDSDAERAGLYEWRRVCSRGIDYAIANIDGAQLFMHRFLLAPPNGVEVDHANGDGLDNRRRNLRLATRQENNRNRRAHRRRSDAASRHSEFKGVSWDKLKGKWRARITTSGGRVTLGRYSDQEAAARAYDDAAREHHGGFARVNFPAGNEAPAR